MANTARRSVWVGVALTVPVVAFARMPSSDGACIPPNLKAGVFQSTVALMCRASPTFRSQCARLAAEPTLRVSLWINPFHPLPGARAHTEISRVRGVLTQAHIVLFNAPDAVELIAHELEHIVEQIEHVQLNETVCDGHRPVAASESCRAIEIGRRVAREVEESGLNGGSRREDVRH